MIPNPCIEVQTISENRFSVPAWFAEVVIIAGYLEKKGVLEAFAHQVRLVRGRWIKLYLLAVAMLMTGLVGISRIYMGVHWPTDVLAGWTAGLVWALICWLVARQLQRRGAVESDKARAADDGD